MTSSRGREKHANLAQLQSLHLAKASKLFSSCYTTDTTERLFFSCRPPTPHTSYCNGKYCLHLPWNRLMCCRTPGVFLRGAKFKGYLQSSLYCQFLVSKGMEVTLIMKRKTVQFLLLIQLGILDK